MSSKKRKWISVICYAVSLVVYGLMLRWGLETFAGSVFFLPFAIFIPLTSFVMALILQVTNAWLKWLYPFLFGSFGLVILLTVYGLPPFFSQIMLSFLPSFLGTGLGYWLRKDSERKS